MSRFYKCVAFDDFRFATFYEDEPVFSDGTPFEEEGSVQFGKYIYDSENSIQFVKDGIAYRALPRLQYSCKYEVVSAENVDEDFDLKYSDIHYAVDYECAYESTGKNDTTFAVTEFQKTITTDELVVGVLSNNVGNLAAWKFYRKDGTLKFKGDEKGGYCFSANGMKKTKQVTSPKYCR